MTKNATWNAIAAAAVIITASACGRNDQSADTLANRKAPCLLSDAAKQGFTGFSGDGVKLQPVDDLDHGAPAFRLFNYEYINPQTDHANRRLVVFSTNCRYLGSYLVDEAPLGFEGQSLKFKDTGIPGDRVDFTGTAPPQTIWIDGTLSNLEK